MEGEWRNLFYLVSCTVVFSIGCMIGYGGQKEDKSYSSLEAVHGVDKASSKTGRQRLEKELLEFGGPETIETAENVPRDHNARSTILESKHGESNGRNQLPAAQPRGGDKVSGRLIAPLTVQKKDRVVIVVYRLPLTLSKVAGKWTVKWKSITEPMANFRFLQDDFNFIWVGYPGVDIPDEEFEEVEELLKKHNCVPVQIPKELREKMYFGFCKTVLWPLFHYQISRNDENFKNHDELFRAYSAINIIFAKKAALVSEFEEEAMVWFHNYHLLLAPTFMRRANPQSKIGLFIHTPFPTSEVFRCLPGRLDLMRGIISADIIGFHTYDYARHFISSAKRLLNLEFETLEGGSLGVLYNGRRVELQVNHVGVQSDKISELAYSPAVQSQAKKLREDFSGLKIILSVDELDVIKGTRLKIQAFKHFLEIHSEWVGQIVFLQILKPSSNIETLRHTREKLLESISQIREEFGKDIIHVFEERPSLERLLSFYRAADVAVFSTFWDGFNTDPHEFTAAQIGRQDPGVLILSEFMGCARSLSGVYRVNPWKMSEVAKTLHSALVLGAQEKLFAHERRYKYVMKYDFRQWVNCFISDLKRHIAFSNNLVCLPMGWGSNVRLIYLPNDYLSLMEHEMRFVSAFRRAKKRLMLFDYGGTLADTSRFVKYNKLPPEILSYMKKLSADPNNWVAIISGMSRTFFAELFEGANNVCIFAEKGAFLRWPKAEGFTRSPDISDISSYKTIARDLMSKYLKKTDGADLREEEAALVWSYENTDPEYGEMQAGELEKYLQRLLKNYPAVVTKYDHSKKIEVAPQSCNKYDATLRILKRFQLETERDGIKPEETFLFCSGNDRSDEEMFSIVEKVGKKWCPDSHFTCSVGMKPSNAKYYVADVSEVHGVLKILAQSM